MYHFEFDHIELGTMLSAMDNNFNSGRSQKKDRDKKKSGLALTIKHHFRVAYRKPSKKIIARKFYEPKQYMYLRDLMEKRLGKQLLMECVTLAKRRGKLWLRVRGLPSPILLEEV